jgi:hypothetical protein
MYGGHPPFSTCMVDIPPFSNDLDVHKVYLYPIHLANKTLKVFGPRFNEISSLQTDKTHIYFIYMYTICF